MTSSELLHVKRLRVARGCVSVVRCCWNFLSSLLFHFVLFSPRFMSIASRKTSQPNTVRRNCRRRSISAMIDWGWSADLSDRSPKALRASKFHFRSYDHANHRTVANQTGFHHATDLRCVNIAFGRVKLRSKSRPETSLHFLLPRTTIAGELWKIWTETIAQPIDKSINECFLLHLRDVHQEMSSFGRLMLSRCCGNRTKSRSVRLMHN